MSASKSQSKQSILSEDGELLHGIETPEPQGKAVFCTNCGSANRDSSRFCRTCGESLEEQIADVDSMYRNVVPGNKEKRSPGWAVQQQPQQQRQATPAMNLWSMCYQLAMLFVMAGLVYYTAREGLWGVSLAVLLAWMCVEGFLSGAIK